MPELQHIVIVGAGLAGATAAKTLREEGYDGRVALLGEENHPPYDHPPLSKDYLRGDSPRPDAYLQPEPFWAEHGIELVTAKATRIDPLRGRVELANGDDLGFDRLLLAPGAEPRRLTVPGSTLDNVLTLRRFEDADAIRDRAEQAGRILVVGGGWIASEVAASLRTLGHDVTLALRGRLPLERALGSDIARVYRDLHAEHGVELLPRTEVASFQGDGSVRGARTRGGAWLDADLVVVAIGVDPRVDLAEGAGLTVADGIVADELLTTTSPRVLAAGDAARVPHQHLARSLRVEHWDTALAQGRHAARVMLGSTQPYKEIPHFFSDQYDTGMEFWGDPDLPGELVVRGDIGSRAFNAFWLRDGQVTAALNLHVHHHDPHDDHGDAGHAHGGAHLDPKTVKQLLRRREPVAAEALADADIPLDDLHSGELSR